MTSSKRNDIEMSQLRSLILSQRPATEMFQSLSTNRLRFRDTKMSTLFPLLLIPSPTPAHTPVEAASLTSPLTEMIDVEESSTHTEDHPAESRVDTETSDMVVISPNTATDPAAALTTTLTLGPTTNTASLPKT